MPRTSEPLLESSSYQRDNDIKRSFSNSQQFIRWSLSALSIILLFIVFRLFEKQGSLTPAQINTFNVVSTALQLLLSLGFFVCRIFQPQLFCFTIQLLTGQQDAFKDLAKVSRWRLLDLSGWDDGEKALLAQIAKWTAVLKLGAKSRAKRWVLWACASWILLNIGAQTSVALINQVYSMQDGTNWKGTYTRVGKVNAADLSCYYHHHYEKQEYACESSPETVHGIAHAYGVYAYGSLTPGNDCVRYDDIDDVLRSQTTPKYYCRRTPGRREFAYRFLEYNPDDTERTYPHLTDRAITASAGQCQQYSFVKVEPVTTKSGRWSNYTYKNGDINGSILLPVAVDTFDGTVYTYQGFKTPEEATTYACGDRCILMWAHATSTRKDDSIFYQCPVTINEVRNAKLPAHEVSRGIARLAAASIGLQGGKSDAVNGWTQSSFFPIANAWDVHGKDIDEVGANMAEFALGSIATMASNNPSVQLNGQRPILGSKLEVVWKSAVALLVTILGAHTALSALSFYMDWYNRHKMLTSQ